MANKPTYTKDEILGMIKTASWKDLESIRIVLKAEIKRYQLYEAKQIANKYKSKIKEWVREDAEILRIMLNI